MTYYLRDHPHNNWNSSTTSSGFLSFPVNTPNHTMVEWEILRRNQLNKVKVGRFMDKVEVVDFVEKMGLKNDDTADGSNRKNIFSLAERTTANKLAETIANEFGEITLEAQFYKTGRSGGVVVCGHRGEVAPDPTITDTFEPDNGRTKAYSDT
eukprot:13270345-Ditylum_brightwellii.AAC.1